MPLAGARLAGMDKGQARALAADQLAEWQAGDDRIDDLKRRSGMDLPLSGTEYVITSVERISGTWCVHYNDRRLVETGEIAYAVAGTGLPTEHFVAAFESRDPN